ncbi:hypothetical protein RJ640_029621 [Escallonia rubra]|uniref:Protein kinase domain-containing protein n=1 Tax=Escallonia rubra TaxID=112253 RepID=A0AA88QX89_9ASTE|nr:hypothetical protein RJ640_029621 [Escallonia rubra]
MKEPSAICRKKPNSGNNHQSKKLRLICSFNGAFRPRPPSGKLRYTGGETRVVSIDKTIPFSKLKSKISDLLRHAYRNTTPQFTLKYHVPNDGVETHLGLMTCDDDVRRMIDEYEKVEGKGKRARVWVYVFFGDDCVDGPVLSNCLQDLSNGFKGLRENGDERGSDLHTQIAREKGFLSGDFGTHLAGGKSSGDSVNGPILVNGFKGLCRNVDGKGTNRKTPTVCENGFQGGTCGTHSVGDKVKRVTSSESLRKMVLKQQLLGKRSGKVGDFRSGSGLVLEHGVMEFGNENGKCDDPFLDLFPTESVSSVNPSFVDNSYRVRMLDSGYRNVQFEESEDFQNLVPLPALSNSQPLNPTDGNLRVEPNCSTCSLSGQSHCSGTSSCNSRQVVAAEQFLKQFCSPRANTEITSPDANYDFRSDRLGVVRTMNRENIMPQAINSDMVRTRFVPPSSSNQLVENARPMKSLYGTDSSVRHRFGSSDTRNQRICPYHIRNCRRTPNVMASFHDVRWYGRTWAEIFVPGLRSSPKISKQGLAVRSYHPNSWTPSCGSHQQKEENATRIKEYGMNNPTRFTIPYGSQENLGDEVGLGVMQHGQLNPGECFGELPGTADQFLLPLNGVENPSSNTRDVDTHLDLLADPGSGQHELPCQTICQNLLIMPMNSHIYSYIKEELHLVDQQGVASTTSFLSSRGYSHWTAIDTGSSYNPFINCPQTIRSCISSSVDLSLHNLSLSSFKEVEPPAPSSPASTEVSEALLKPQSTPPELMDEEDFSLDLRVEKSSEIASISISDNESMREKDNDQNTETQYTKKTDKCSTVEGVYLLTVVQTIKSSDLEYIKELGSGTYGTVFYGKWKGSDVAIKRLKPSCFTDGAVQEDRLVADFWKEAHILGQLHHPNIVALYGVVTDGPVTNLATVTEYMVNGSLKQVLRRKDRTIDRRKRLIIARDAAFGMEYLHGKNIVHFDLKSHNFLMNMRDPLRPVCKIGDLGLSKIKQKTLVSGGVRGTIPWMAPELLNSESMVTEKVDVYSFGIVMWELLAGEEPYTSMRSEEIIAGIIKGNLRPEIPCWCDPAWRSLMERCWSSDPDARPAFSEIAKELRAMAAAMNII